MIFAPTFPISFDDTNGFQNVQDMRELAKFHLKNLLLTSKGEKISDPNFGVGMRKFLFSQESEGIEAEIKFEIENQVENYLTYLALTDIIITLEEQQLNIKLKFVLSGDSETQILDLDLSSLSSGNPTTIYWGLINAKKTNYKIF